MKLRKGMKFLLKYAPYIPVFGLYIILGAAISDVPESEVEFAGQDNPLMEKVTMIIQLIGGIALLLYVIGTLTYFIFF